MEDAETSEEEDDDDIDSQDSTIPIDHGNLAWNSSIKYNVRLLDQYLMNNSFLSVIGKFCILLL